ncbi:MAG: MazG family protein [Lachnospiraceae bacterium]
METIQKKRYTYEELLEIIATLRGEGGCPWDREQTHASLKSCLMEEAAELAAAIRIYTVCGDYENFIEELGDVLLQVVMHSQIAKEEGLFSMEEVVDAIATKMVRRHPHVFADTVASDSPMVLENWEKIKKIEKASKKYQITPLRELPLELPALTRATKVLKKSQQYYGSEAEDLEIIIERLKQQIDILQNQVADKDMISETITNMLWELSNISNQYKIQQEELLNEKIENYIAKYE